MKIIKIIIITCFITQICKLHSVELTTKQTELLKSLETLYNQHNIIKSRFIQIDNLGNNSKGWFIIDKPGKVRVDYDNIPIKMIINSNSLMLQNTKQKQKSFLPVLSNPFIYLLEEKISFFSNNISITRFQENDNFVEIGIKSKENPSLGEIFLFLDTETADIIKWIVKDAKGIQTTIFLISPNFISGKIITNGIFNVQRVREIKYTDIIIN